MDVDARDVRMLDGMFGDAMIVSRGNDEIELEEPDGLQLVSGGEQPKASTSCCSSNHS